MAFSGYPNTISTSRKNRIIQPKRENEIARAMVRSALGVMPHLLGALVVALLIMIVGAFAMNQFPKHPTLRPAAISLMVITGIQVFLGMAAFIFRMMNITVTTAWLAISVAHVATGSLTFAASVVFALEIRRNVLPREVTS